MLRFPITVAQEEGDAVKLVVPVSEGASIEDLVQQLIVRLRHLGVVVDGGVKLMTDDGAALLGMDIVGEVLASGEAIEAKAVLSAMRMQETSVQTEVFEDKSEAYREALEQIESLKGALGEKEEKLVHMSNEVEVWKGQSDKLAGLLGPRDHELWDAEQQLDAFKADNAKLSVERTVFQEQCQQLSEALTNATRAQEGFMDVEAEVAPLRRELSQLRLELESGRQHVADFDALHEHTQTMKQEITHLSASIDTLTERLSQEKAEFALLDSHSARAMCKAVVEECIWRAVFVSTKVELQTVNASVKGLQAELQVTLKHIETNRTTTQAVDSHTVDVINEMKIELKKKEILIKQLQSVVKEGAGGTAGSNRSSIPVTSEVVEHENGILRERLAAAEDLNEALQKMMQQQELVVGELTEDNDRKTSIIEAFALDASTPSKLNPSYEAPPAKKTFFRLKKSTNPADKQAQLQKALEDALSANTRLRLNVAHLDDELARLNKR